MKLYGKNSIRERLAINPLSIRKIYFNQKSHACEIEKLAADKEICCVNLNETQFNSMCEHNNAQGVIADVDEFKYASLDEILLAPCEQKPVILALSNITDVQNLGSIIRTAACFGKVALMLPKHRNAQVNETVLKVACGGENYVPIILETNLINAIKELKQAGYWITGTVVDEGDDITGFRLTFPLCLVIGSEDKGIREGLKKHLDFRVTLPMPGAKLSLNAAVATAVFCYEITRQRVLL